MGYFRMPFTLRDTEMTDRVRERQRVRDRQRQRVRDRQRQRVRERDRDRELIQLPAVNSSHTSCHDFHNTYTCI